MKNPTASVGSEPAILGKFDPRTIQPVVSRYTDWATEPNGRPDTDLNLLCAPAPIPR
jgi:hypothetical protein